MGAELDALLDIAGARRPGNEIDGPRQGAILGTLAVPGLFIGADDLVGAQHDDLGIGE